MPWTSAGVRVRITFLTAVSTSHQNCTIFGLDVRQALTRGCSSSSVRPMSRAPMDLQLADSKDVAAATLAVVQLKENGIESLVKGMLTFAKGEERDLYLGVIERGLLEIGALLKEYNVI